MKILHTADWHLGRQFEGSSLEQDHGAILDQVFQGITEHAPDVLIIAGDVFDRAAPPETAVRQFNGFLTRVVSETDTAIVIIAGNHDSGDRIGAIATLSDGRRSLVRGPLTANEPPLVLYDEHGPVAISALPFGYEFAARECFADSEIKCPENVIRAQLAAARRHVPDGARWVVVAHAFISGGNVSGCERPLSRLVGGIESGNWSDVQRRQPRHQSQSGLMCCYRFGSGQKIWRRSIIGAPACAPSSRGLRLLGSCSKNCRG